QVLFNVFFNFGFACWIALEKYIYKRISLRTGNSLEYGIQGSANILSAYFNFPKTTMVSERCLQVPFNAFLFLDLLAGLRWKSIFISECHCGVEIPWNIAFREEQIF